MKPNKKNKLSILSILLAFFVDMLGWSIVFPIFAPLFLDQQNMIFASTVATSTRTTLLGIFLAAFPLAQFFGAPLLGELSDAKGRKKALLLSLMFAAVGYGISAASIIMKNLYLLFFSRIIAGLFSGTLSVCMAALSDVATSRKDRVRYFGYLSILSGLSFILGSFIGGYFSDKHLSSFFHPSLPFWIAAFLSLINLFFLWTSYHETPHTEKKINYSLLESVKLIHQAIMTRGLLYIYGSFFFFIIGWTILFQFTPLLVIQNFHFTNAQIGNTAAFMGICWMLGSLMSSSFPGEKKNMGKNLQRLLFIFTLLVFFLVSTEHLSHLFIVLASTMFVTGMTWPLFPDMVSEISPPSMQGKILGVSQSMQSLAMTISPIIGGLASNVGLPLTFLLAGVSSLIGAGIFTFYNISQKKMNKS